MIDINIINLSFKFLKFHADWIDFDLCATPSTSGVAREHGELCLRQGCKLLWKDAKLHLNNELFNFY